MFQIIVAAIAIAVVSLLAIATIFYGGTVFQASGEKGRFDGYVNEGQQIQAGMKLYNVDTGGTTSGSSSTQFNTLTTNNYLSSVPEGNWVIDNSVIYKPLTDTSQCMRFNKYAGKDVDNTSIVGSDGVTTVKSSGGCPPCDDTAFAGYPGCQSSTVSANETTSTSAAGSTGTGTSGGGT